MNRDLHEYRKLYEQGSLTIENVAENPFDQFENWFTQADATNEIEEANAMTLSTIGDDGFPRGRVVLLKEYSKQGFVLYTNYTSAKGKAIANNPEVCLSFFWPALEQQIIITGVAEKTSEEHAAAYFSKRPRKSQLGALTSDQSSPIADRKALEDKLSALEKKYEGKDIPKPKNWGGYCIKPISFEFWQGRSSRLHDRIQYIKNKNGWEIRRVQP